MCSDPGLRCIKTYTCIAKDIIVIKFGRTSVLTCDVSLHIHIHALPRSLLRELYLDYCGVGDEGVLAIADALRASSNLR